MTGACARCSRPDSEPLLTGPVLRLCDDCASALANRLRQHLGEDGSTFPMEYAVHLARLDEMLKALWPLATASPPDLEAMSALVGIMDRQVVARGLVPPDALAGDSTLMGLESDQSDDEDVG